MLNHLSINNIVLIEQLNIDFDNGLCVLTGETGAGKSILLDSLGFVLGYRSSSQLLRHGTEKASVIANFTIPNDSAIFSLLNEYDIEVENGNELLLRRNLSFDGKNKAFINDCPVSISLLKQIGSHLIEIHGQHDQKGLLDSSQHQEIIDAFGKLKTLTKEVNQSHLQYKTLLNELNLLYLAKEKAQEEEDYLKHICQELEDLSPQEGEEEFLAEKRSELMNQEKYIQSLQEASNAIANSAIEQNIIKAQKSLNKVNNDITTPVIESLERCMIEINESKSLLDQALYSINENDSNLEDIEQRLFSLRAASRKYNVPVEELLTFRNKKQDELNLITNNSDKISKLEKEAKELKQNFITLANKLSNERQKAGAVLENKIHSELPDLKMENTRFKVNFTTLEEANWNSNGIDKIEFIASTNPGSPLQPINKIASGGELSRFMLALKVALAEIKSTPTMIFDEIDTGIGGATADAVGKKLAFLGQQKQVLVVTHQPQVAAKGKQHLKIIKTNDSNSTKTNVETLSDIEERNNELARMLAGAKITDEAKAAAKILLETNT